MTNGEIIAVLEEIGMLLELKGENPFKSKAYRNAYRTLEASEIDIATLVKTGKLSDLPGIGPALTQKITELVETGKLKYLEELRAEIPPGLIELTRIPGLGPKKARLLCEKLDIHSVGELEYACKENRLLTLEGFGAKTQANILKSIGFYKNNGESVLFEEADLLAHAIGKELQQNKHIKNISVAGSLRRKKEIIGDIDFVVATDKPQAVIASFTELKYAAQIVNQGETKSSIRTADGRRVDLLCVSEKEYPYALHHFTGSKEHNVAMRGRAQALGYKMNEFGLFKGEKLVPCKNEEEIFKSLGLDFIPPELREDRDEIEAAEKKKLPHLITLEDLKGTFHAHTLYSDGKSSVIDMAEAARKRGLTYLGLADHSQSAFYAHGMKAADIKRQHDEIDELNRGFKSFKIFKGVESDILADGSLDYDDKTLEEFDFVIASVHSRFKMTEDEMTERIVRALKNPFTTMLGHMTGRLLLSRAGYALNVKKIIDTAAEENKIIELNAHPQRLDIDWRHLKYAKDQGVKIAINPDAHKMEGFDDLIFGINMARKGWLEKGDVVNTITLPQMEKFLS